MSAALALALLAAAPAGLPGQWPVAVATADAAPDWRWQQVFADPRLARVIGIALVHNQDAAAAVARVAAARAAWRGQRAALFPELDAGLGYARGGGAASRSPGDSFSASIAAPAWELDLFGRVASLTSAERSRWQASQANLRQLRLALVAAVADAWLAHAADASLLALARETAQAARASEDLTRHRVEGGIALLADLRKAELVRHAAEADIARQTTAVAQDANAVNLLAGSVVAPAELPDSLDGVGSAVMPLAADLPAEVLARRPDVVAAEAGLAATGADLRAARAALFPRLTLSGLASTASSTIANLFTPGTQAWSAASALVWPVFAGGRSRAALAAAGARRDEALALYRRALQAAFADTADVLARRDTIADQLAADTAGAAAAGDNLRLTEARYRQGAASALDLHSAEIAAYAARRSEVGTRLAELSSRVALYRALAGDNPVPPQENAAP